MLKYSLSAKYNLLKNWLNLKVITKTEDRVLVNQGRDLALQEDNALEADCEPCRCQHQVISDPCLVSGRK